MDDENKFENLECPFNWNLNTIPERQPGPELLERLSEKDEEIATPWVSLCVNITIAYLHYEDQKYEKALLCLKDCHHQIDSSEDELIKKYKVVFSSIYSACRATLCLKTSTKSEVKKFAEQMKPMSQFSTVELAALNAIKANVFLEFGVYGTHRALPFAQEALKLNSLEPEWHFLVGKLLGRIRHFQRIHMPSACEISHLQTAYSLSKSKNHAIFLAMAYIEKSKAIHFNSKNAPCNRTTKQELNALASEAKQLILYALKENNNQCVHVNIRCAFGLSNLPFHERDMEKARQLLEDVLTESPTNAMANKFAGDLCLKLDRPMYDKALKHYTAAASKHVYSAECAIFEINTKLDRNPDPEKFYSKLLSKYKEKNYQLQTMIHAVEYYVFIRRDLFKALHYFMEALKVDPYNDMLTERFVKYIKQNINFYELLANEVNIALKNQMWKNHEHQNILQKVIAEIRNHKPDLLHKTPDPNKIQKLVEAATTEENLRLNKQNNRGRGKGRGFRGNNSVRGRGAVGRNSTSNSNINDNNYQRNDFRGRGNQRGGGNRSGSQDRRRETHAKNQQKGRSRNSSHDRSRNSSRERIDQKYIESLVAEQLAKLNLHMNPFKANTDKKLVDMYKSCEGDVSNEDMNNPYFVRYLEDKYKKKNHNDSFQEWLAKSSSKYQSPRYSIIDLKDDGSNNVETQKTIEITRDKLQSSKSHDYTNKSSHSRRENKSHSRSKKHELRTSRHNSSDYSSHSRSSDVRSRHDSPRNYKSQSKYDQKTRSRDGSRGYSTSSRQMPNDERSRRGSQRSHSGSKARRQHSQSPRRFEGKTKSQKHSSRGHSSCSRSIDGSEEGSPNYSRSNSRSRGSKKTNRKDLEKHRSYSRSIDGRKRSSHRYSRSHSRSRNNRKSTRQGSREPRSRYSRQSDRRGYSECRSHSRSISVSEESSNSSRSHSRSRGSKKTERRSSEDRSCPRSIDGSKRGSHRRNRSHSRSRHSRQSNGRSYRKDRSHSKSRHNRRDSKKDRSHSRSSGGSERSSSCSRSHVVSRNSEQSKRGGSKEYKSHSRSFGGIKKHSGYSRSDSRSRGNRKTERTSSEDRSHLVSRNSRQTKRRGSREHSSLSRSTGGSEESSGYSRSHSRSRGNRKIKRTSSKDRSHLISRNSRQSVRSSGEHRSHSKSIDSKQSEGRRSSGEHKSNSKLIGRSKDGSVRSHSRSRGNRKMKRKGSEDSSHSVSRNSRQPMRRGSGKHRSYSRSTDSLRSERQGKLEEDNRKKDSTTSQQSRSENRSVKKDFESQKCGNSSKISTKIKEGVGQDKTVNNTSQSVSDKPRAESNKIKKDEGEIMNSVYVPSSLARDSSPD